MVEKPRSLHRRRPSSSALVAFLAMALAAMLAVAPPVSAQEEQPAVDPMIDRAQTLTLWLHGGPTVRAAAAEALTGTEADIDAFLTTELPRAQAIDQRISVNRILAAGGPATKEAAQLALDSTTDGALLAFLEDGWQTPAGHDLRIRVNQMLAAGGPELQQAAQTALDNGTQEALESFLETGWKTPHEHDQRIRINQILAGGGPEVRAAAQRALDAATGAAYTQFLEHDHAIAEARDQETATVAQLAAAAEDAGKLAARETNAAKQASAKAVREAELAKQAAQRAAAAAASAGNNSAQAASAAGRAAAAANNAATAAREAVTAANAANAAARVAAGAASRAAAAAANAGQAASRAYSAASAAAVDASKASEARQAAEAARRVAAGARQAAAAAGAAEQAVNHALDAASAASSAANNAAAAGQAAAEAAGYANSASAEAAAARRAAATARANAERASRAATATEAFAATAARAAATARAAANRAASDAEAAAAAADDAAEHAGEAAEAANRATQHANAATEAANAAIAAAEQAQEVYEAARVADAERIATEFAQNQELALAASQAQAQAETVDRWKASQAQLRDEETARLLALARDPATEPAQAVAAARKVALALAETGGPWTQSAAYLALEGPDAVAMDFVRTGLDTAAGQDDRQTLLNLTKTGTDGFVAAAEAALAGSDADVAAFLEDPDYPSRVTEDRIAVNQILATAQENKNTTVQRAAQAALDAGDGDSLRYFLTDRQYTARASDERIKINQILAADTSGPELKAAAQVALDGTSAMRHQFLTVGRYYAAQQDHDSAMHNAKIAGLLADASRAAVTASENANEAQAVAARARGAAEQAAGYAEQAQRDANQAANYANQAHQSALQAEESATRAAQSAATARDAANQARQSARQASWAANWATASANQAARFASQAYDSAHAAYASAQAAGEDAEAAAAAARDAIDTAIQKVQDLRSQEALRQATTCQVIQEESPEVYDECINSITVTDFDRGQRMLENGSLCELAYGHMKGTPGHQTCLANVLSPTFETDLLLVQAAALMEMGLTVASTLATVELAIACDVFAPCAALMLGASPEFSALMPWATRLLASGTSALTAARISGLFERTKITDHTLFARLAQASTKLLRNCFVQRAKLPAAPALIQLTAADACWAEKGGPGSWGIVRESLRHGDRNAEYQFRVTGVPLGIGYWVDGIKFDGYRNGVLLDAKGYYKQFLNADGTFKTFFAGAFEFVKQAQRQLRVARATPVRWIFHEAEAATATRKLFADEGIVGIDIVVVP